MSQPLPSAPPGHDQRNQNETRRIQQIVIDQLHARLAALEAAIAG